MDLDISYINDEPININIPIKITYKVVSAQPAIKGNTSSGATKIVTLENNLTLSTPLFIKEGDYIVVNTEKGEYVERSND